MANKINKIPTENRAVLLTNVAGFIIRVIILITIVITLLYFAQIYNQLVFTVMTLLLLISIIVEGIGQMFRKKE